MGIRHDLQRSIQQVLNHNRSGSYATQANRKYILRTFAADLVSIGYGLRDIHGLKQKHILAVVKHWQEKGLSNSTIKNRTAALRMLCDKINKNNIIPDNNAMNIGKRSYKPTSNRAIHDPDFSKISNKHIYISLQLQRVFGLRREESIKIKPHLADKSDKLDLLSSWCKGGRSRSISIRTEEQRYWLEQAKTLVGKFGNSLIPEHKSYIQQRCVYDKQTLRAGLKNLHGLRHAYAQKRYKELTGWEAPINGGPTSRELTKEQKEIDYQARMILTEELGHSRIEIVKNYCL
jgi:site-specific recombinase XerC